MKKMKGFRKVLAGLLVLCMVMGCGVGALADVSFKDSNGDLVNIETEATYPSDDSIGGIVGGIWVNDDNDGNPEEISVCV